MKTIIPLFVAAAIVSACPAVASAHAFLDHADPKVGSTIDSSPPQVKAWFTQHLEPKFSSMQVFDSNGNQVDKQDSHVDDNDPTLLILSIPALSPGTYTVKWSVVSVDTHHTHGSFEFTVKTKQ